MIDMLFSEALNMALANYDRASESLRQYLADASHVNLQSKEMTQACNDRNEAMRQIDRVRQAWYEADLQKRKGSAG